MSRFSFNNIVLVGLAIFVSIILIAPSYAQAIADSKIATAKAEAESIRLHGDAEADAIKQRGEALRDNPGLVSLTTAERWDGKLPATMIPGSSVPFINAK